MEFPRCRRHARGPPRADKGQQTDRSTEVPEKWDTSTATAEVRIRVTADSHQWITQDTFWPAPYLTHYGASSVRLSPQYSDPKFIGENLSFLDKWAKDAQTRNLAALTIAGYHRKYGPKES